MTTLQPGQFYSNNVDSFYCATDGKLYLYNINSKMELAEIGTDVVDSSSLERITRIMDVVLDIDFLIAVDELENKILESH